MVYLVQERTNVDVTMEKNERIIAITRILPGLETFLREVLANESLTPPAEKQRVDFLKKLEELTKPPGLPPRPANLKSQSRASVDSIDSVENADNDFASVQRKLSNIFYLRRDFDELNEHVVNGFVGEDGGKGTGRKNAAKGGKRKASGKGIYEPLPTRSNEVEADSESGVLSGEDERLNRSVNLARGAQIRQSLSRGKWFAKKEKCMSHEVFVSDLQLPTISGHLIEVRTSKRRWCVLKDQHLYVFKNQEEPALFEIALPGCDISTVPKSDKAKVSYSFKITQDTVAEIILGIEEEKDLSAWMNALITASVAKNPLSPPAKFFKSLPRPVPRPWSEEGGVEGQGDGSSRRHTLGSQPMSDATMAICADIDVGTYEMPTDVMGLTVSLDTQNYNPPLPPLPGEITDFLDENEDHTLARPLSKCSGIYEEVGDELIHKYSLQSPDNRRSDSSSMENISADLSTVDEKPHDDIPNGNRRYSEAASSDSEYSSDELDDELKDENENITLFHDRWAVHSGLLYQKRQIGWNRRYCKIVDNCLRGFKNPNDLTPVLELNLSASSVREAEAEGKRKYIFQLNTAESESFYFNTDTKESLERWIEVISVTATSRLEHSTTLSEEELDETVEVCDDLCASRESIPSPVPERVESLRRSRVISETNGETKKCDEDIRVEQNSSVKNGELVEQQETLEDKKRENLDRKTEEYPSEDVWRKRDSHPSYATTPRSKTSTKFSKSKPVKDASKHGSTRSLEFPSRKLNSTQKTLQVSTKRKYSERLKKYLDKDGQFSGFILELRIKPNSTTLTRRWAVVQNGLLRIYENYGCAAPFLRICLVEAFLKDFSNVEKARFCFMLEYGVGQSILFQTNTHQELKRWINVITLTIACHTDLFGSGWDLRKQDRTSRDLLDRSSSLNRPASLKRSNFSDKVDGKEEISDDVFGAGDTLPQAASGTCDDREVLTCTPALVRETVHRKSYSMSSSGSLDSDDVISRSSSESFAHKSSCVQKVRHRGFLRVSRVENAQNPREIGVTESPEDSSLKFCELKGSLFSVFHSEKLENPEVVFNLLYDKYNEVSASGELAFTLTSDKEGTVKFGCETEENLNVWKRVVSTTALQDETITEESTRSSSSLKLANDASIARKRSSLRASYAEEEAKHHEVLAKLDEDFRKGEITSECTPYSCYVYEVRDSSGNKTIIRRWCIVNGDLIQIFERETSREAVAELRPSAYRLKDIDSPRYFPFAFKLEPLSFDEEDDDGEFLVIQASSALDFRELLTRIKLIHLKGEKFASSKSESNFHVVKKSQARYLAPLNYSKGDLSLRKIFSLARKSSKDNIVCTDPVPPGHDTWPKVIRREKKPSRRALSDTSSERLVTNSLIENLREREKRKSMAYFLFDSEGKFSGYLTEVRNNTLCRSEVRKWCVVKDDKFSTFDDKNAKNPSAVIDLARNVQLLDLSHVTPNTFELRVTTDVIHGHVFRASNDFPKWVTVLALAVEMCQTKDSSTGRSSVAHTRSPSRKVSSCQSQASITKRKDGRKGN